MPKFDENLIVFQKIFKVKPILDVYLNSEDDKLKGSKKLDLFSFGAGQSMALFLGSMYEHEEWHHYFLIELIAGFPEKMREAYLFQTGNCGLWPNFTNKKLINEDVLKHEHKNLTIENFLNLFDEAKFKVNCI